MSIALYRASLVTGIGLSIEEFHLYTSDTIKNVVTLHKADSLEKVHIHRSCLEESGFYLYQEDAIARLKQEFNLTFN